MFNFLREVGFYDANTGNKSKAEYCLLRSTCCFLHVALTNCSVRTADGPKLLKLESLSLREVFDTCVRNFLTLWSVLFDFNIKLKKWACRSVYAVVLFCVLYNFSVLTAYCNCMFNFYVIEPYTMLTKQLFLREYNLLGRKYLV